MTNDHLKAVSLPGGIINLEFRGDDGVKYEIWRRHGDTVDWYLHATTEAQIFEDSPVTPGQYYEYKVRSVHGDSLSDFSTSAVVYGVA